MYFKMESDPTTCTGYLRRQNNEHETLMRGAIVEEQSLNLPYEFTLRLRDEEEASFIDFYGGKKLISKRFAAFLESVGVNNLQTFPVRITEVGSGRTYGDFLKFNVLGLVSCADESKSSGTPVADVKFFDKLTIDDERTQGLKLFRLAESRMDIIVSKEVVDAVQAEDFMGIDFVPV